MCGNTKSGRCHRAAPRTVGGNPDRGRLGFAQPEGTEDTPRVRGARGWAPGSLRPEGGRVGAAGLLNPFPAGLSV